MQGLLLHRPSILKILVTAVAKNSIPAVFASAEIDRSIFLCRVGSRCEIRTLMGAVTKGLRGTLAAGAPIVGFSGSDMGLRNG